MIFDAGATSARVDQARAAHAQTAARYRQTVLTAFQDVEDQLIALRVLQQQQACGRRRAARPTWWSSRCSTATRRARSATPR